MRGCLEGERAEHHVVLHEVADLVQQRRRRLLPLRSQRRKLKKMQLAKAAALTSKEIMRYPHHPQLVAAMAVARY